MHGDPGTRKDSSETAPHNAPDCSATREVGTMISSQRAVVDGGNGAGIDKGTLKQIVEKDEKQHYGGGKRKGACYGMSIEV